VVAVSLLILIPPVPPSGILRVAQSGKSMILANLNLVDGLFCLHALSTWVQVLTETCLMGVTHLTKPYSA